MRLLPWLAAIALCLSAAADVKLKARTTVGSDSFDSAIFVRASRQRVESGKYSIVTIYQCDLHRMVRLNPQTKTYRIVALDSPADASNIRPARTPRTGAAPEVTFTTTFTAGSAERKIRGLTAREFSSRTEAEAPPNSCSKAESIKLTTVGWYADLPGSDLSCADGSRASLRLRRLDPTCTERTHYRVHGEPPAGLPLELETTMNTSSGPVTEKQETLELQELSLPTDLFDVPAGYRLVRTEEELLAGPADTPAAPAPETPSSSRPSRSTRTGEPRLALPRICLQTVIDTAPRAEELLPTLQLGSQLNRSGLESIPLGAIDEKDAVGKAKEQGCSFLLSAEITHSPPDGEHQAQTSAEFVLTPLASDQKPSQITIQLKEGETREAFFERAAQTIAAEIQRHARQ